MVQKIHSDSLFNGKLMSLGIKNVHISIDKNILKSCLRVAVNWLISIVNMQTAFIYNFHYYLSFRWRHNVHYGVSNHQPHHCLLNHLFRCRSKKTSKLHVTGLRVWNSPVSGEFPTQMANYAENDSIWWHHILCLFIQPTHTINHLGT